MNRGNSAVTLRLTEAEHSQLKRAARRHRVPLSAWIRWVLAREASATDQYTAGDLAARSGIIKSSAARRLGEILAGVKR